MWRIGWLLLASLGMLLLYACSQEEAQSPLSPLDGASDSVKEGEITAGNNLSFPVIWSCSQQGIGFRQICACSIAGIYRWMNPP